MSQEIKDGTQDMFEISKGDLTAFKNVDVVGDTKRPEPLRRSLMWAAVASGLTGIVGAAVIMWLAFRGLDESESENVTATRVLLCFVILPVLNLVVISLVFKLVIWATRRKGVRKDRTYEI